MVGASQSVSPDWLWGIYSGVIFSQCFVRRMDPPEGHCFQGTVRPLIYQRTIFVCFQFSFHIHWAIELNYKWVSAMIWLHSVCSLTRLACFPLSLFLSDIILCNRIICLVMLTCCVKWHDLFSKYSKWAVFTAKSKQKINIPQIFFFNLSFILQLYTFWLGLICQDLNCPNKQIRHFSDVPYLKIQLAGINEAFTFWA